MTSIKVSVVIPVYNTESYLEQCLESVLSQSLNDIEVIIVNDCSPDGSKEIINKFLRCDSRVVCIEHKANKGLPEARNSGMAVANGKYLIHLDSDDYWLDKNMLRNLYQVAEIDDCEILRFNGRFLGGDNSSKLIIDPASIINGNFTEHPQLWIYRSIFLYFFRKSFLEEKNIKCVPGINIGEDAIFISLALTRAKRVSSLPDAYYAYRIDNLSLMRKPWSLQDFLEEEQSASIVSGNIKQVKNAYITYWTDRLNNYWSTKIAVRALYDLDDQEREIFYNKVINSIRLINVGDLEACGRLTYIGKNTLRFLKDNNLDGLQRFIEKNNSKANPQARSIRGLVLRIKKKVRPLLVKSYWTCKRVTRYVKELIEKFLKIAILKDREFKNLEGDKDYNFILTRKEKLPGASAMLRIKNEELRILPCLESIIELFEEVVVIDNGSTDSSVTIVEKFKASHPLGNRVSLHFYPFAVARCGSEHNETPECSVHNLAYYYNWCVSRCRFSVICKWDADMLLSAKTEDKECFKRYIMSLVLSKKPCIGSVPVQTMYIDSESKKYLARDEINQEVRFFPNNPSVYFEKAELWERIKSVLPINSRPLKKCFIYEVKDVADDEFSHWSSTTFTGRKVIEYRNFMRVKNNLHLNAPEYFLEFNAR